MLEIIKKFLKKDERPDISEITGEIYPQAPRVKLLNNGIISSVLCDSGASFLRGENGDITKNSGDLLRAAAGIFCSVVYDDVRIYGTFAPKYSSEASYETAFSSSSVSYFARTPKLKMTQKVSLDKGLGCERREVILENRHGGPLSLKLQFSLSPSNAVNFSFDREKRILFARLSKTETLTAGFCEPNGIIEAKRAKNIIYTEITLQKGEKRRIEFLSAYLKKGELTLFMRHRVRCFSEENCAAPPFERRHAESRLCNLILARTLYKGRDCSAQVNAISENTRGTSGLRLYGISTELPIVSCDIYSSSDMDRVKLYKECHEILTDCFFPFELIFLCRCFDKERPDKVKKAVTELIGKSKDNIKIIDKSALPAGVISAIYAHSDHIATRSMVRIETPHRPFSPIKLLSVGKSFESKDEKHYTLALPSFGTTMGRNSLGHCWAFDRIKNKITEPGGEIIILRMNKDYYDLTFSAEFEKTPQAGIYSGKIGDIETKVTVSLAQSGAAKLITVEIINKSPEKAAAEIAFYMEPLLHSDRSRARFIKGEEVEGGVIIKNSSNEAIECYLALGTKSGGFSLCCDRAEFLSGRWNSDSFYPLFDPCAALIERRSIYPNQKTAVTFFIAAAATRYAAVQAVNSQRPRIKPPILRKK